MKYLLFFLFIGTSLLGFSQENVLTLQPMFGKEALTLNKKYYIGNEWIECSALRFYVSNITFYKGANKIKDQTMRHLMDLENPESLQIAGVPETFDSICFALGLDSLTNVSGILDGDLDPILGMYWAWNSGYINLKLEGHSSMVHTADQLFEFHIGGYLPPFTTLQTICLPWNQKENLHVIGMDISKLLNAVNLDNDKNIMIPGKQAHELSKLFPTMFNTAKSGF